LASAVICQQLETFRREAADHGEGAGLPPFIEREFRESLTCGVLAHGLARARCDGCALERLVPFSDERGLIDLADRAVGSP